MDGYKPPFTITNSILSHVASVSEKVGRITVMSNMENKPHAIEELGMNWVQLLDVDASDIYGIYAIPRTFLVDPTGIVIDKNLRGEKLEEALSKLFE